MSNRRNQYPGRPRKSGAARLGAAVLSIFAAGAAVGVGHGANVLATTAYHAYENHEHSADAANEAREARDQRHLRRILQPALTELGTDFLTAAHKDHVIGDFYVTPLPNGDFDITTPGAGLGEAVMGGKTVQEANGTLRTVPDPTKTKYVELFSQVTPTDTFTFTGPGGLMHAKDSPFGSRNKGYAAHVQRDGTLNDIDSTQPDGINAHTQADAAQSIVDELHDDLKIDHFGPQHLS